MASERYKRETRSGSKPRFLYINGLSFDPFAHEIELVDRQNSAVRVENTFTCNPTIHLVT